MRAGACEAINATNSAQGTTRFISSKNTRLRVRLVFAFESGAAKAHLLHGVTVLHPRGCAEGFADFPYLLAVLEGKKAEAERLGKLLERRNALGLRVIETAPSPREEDDPQGQR